MVGHFPGKKKRSDVRGSFEMNEKKKKKKENRTAGGHSSHSK
jgi:hypothetical protein